MVKSMTGYGIRSTNLGKTTLTVEIKTVNSRFLDFSPKLPSSIYHLEMHIKKIIQTYFKRGRIEVTVTITGEGITNKALQVDWNLLDAYVDKLNQAKVKYKLTGDLPISAITMIEDVFSIEESSVDTNEIQALLSEEVEAVAKLVVLNRATEGRYLIKDVNNRVNSMKSMLKSIEDCQEVAAIHYHKRIKQRIEQHLGKEIAIDQTQLIQEISLLAEKGDITEEITRLHSHFIHMDSVISNGGTIGRTLDFITQELHREVNTIGAKSIDPKVSEIVVVLKSNIEKIKEQIQNIE